MLNLNCVMLSGGASNDLSVENRHFGLMRLPGPYIIRDILEQNGVNVKIIDYAQYWTDEQSNRILDYIYMWADVVTISDTFLDEYLVERLARKIKKRNPDTVIIAGGAEPSRSDCKFIDYRIYSYGENAIIKVLEHAFLDKDLNFEFRNNTKFVNALHAYPAWPKEDYSFKYKDEDYMTPYDVGSIELSRGCRFKCKFCNWPILGIKEDTSQVDIQNMIDCLNSNYDNYGIKYYILADDTFNDRTSKLEKLVKITNGLNFDVRFSGFARLDLLWSMPEQIDLMIEAKYNAPHFGVETFNVKAGKAIGKGKQAEIAQEQLLYVVDKFEKANLEYVPSVSMIIGLPYESKESIMESFDWMETYYKRQVTWYPLEISVHGETLSAFGTNFSDYGYDLRKGLGYSPVKRLHGSKWRNQYFTDTTANELARELNKTSQFSRENNWFQGYTNVPTMKKAAMPQEYIMKRIKDLV